MNEWSNILNRNVALRVLAVGPISYTLTVTQLSSLWPNGCAKWFQYTKAITQTISEFMPVTRRYTLQLTENGYYDRVELLSHLLPMQWLLPVPFFLYLVFVRSARDSLALTKNVSPRSAEKSFMLILLMLCISMLIFLIGPSIDFSDTTTRYSVLIHKSNSWFYLSAVATSTMFFFVAVLVQLGRRVVKAGS